MANNFEAPRPFEQYLLTIILILISGFLVYTQAAKRLDLLAYDLAINFNKAPVEENTVIIAIDEKSLNSIGQWPWRRAIHAQLVDKLTSYNAALISLDILFSERSRNHPEDDELLAKAIKNNGSVLLPLHLQPLTQDGTLVEILPIPALVDAARSMGHVHVDLDIDGLARGLYLNTGVGDAYWPSLSMAMASEINPMIQYMRQRDNLTPAPYMSVNTQYRLIPFVGPSGTFPTYSYIDVMLNQVPAEAFRDKVVLIGATAPGLGDIIPTPVSQVNNPMSGVELHANAFSALITNTAVSPVEKVWAYLLTFAFILIPILVFPRLKPTYVMPFSMLLVGFVLLFSYTLLVLDETWFPPVNSIICILLAYPLWSWQRMRHLNGFLNAELEKLQKEPTISFRDTSQHSLDIVFESLKSLLNPQAFLYEKNDQIISQSSQDFKLVRVDTHQKWFHTQQISYISLQRKLDKKTTESIFIGFKWADDANLEAVHAYLNKLNLEPKSTNGKKHYYERIANRIEQVREAIHAMQDMRTFISKGFEDIPNAVMVTDPLGIIVYTNTLAKEWFAEKETLEGVSIYNLFHQNTYNAFHEKMQQSLLYGTHLNLEIQHTDKDLLIHCTPFLVDAKTDSGLMLTFSDITEIREQQRQKNQLIDFLSHDVRSPLVSQLALLDTFKQGKARMTKASLDKLAMHAQRSLSLSDQFLQITRAEQLSELQFYEFDLVNTLDNSLDSVNDQALQKNITLEVEENEGIWLVGNAELLERALTNILSNAVKYSPENTQVNISFEEDEHYCELSIHDQGYGIDADELPHIFKRFHRQRSSEMSGNKGAGLGLNFVKVVIEKHHGTVSVDSSPGQGTCFKIRLPKSHEKQ